MDEPRYVDNDSDGVPVEEEDLSWQTLSGIERTDIIERAKKVCRRYKHPFHSQAEKNKWLKIDKQVVKGTISDEWLEFCFHWAWEKNSTTLRITMPKLASLILNKARMTDFHATMNEERGMPTIGMEDLAQNGF
jgi:hypothetical protein